AWLVACRFYFTDCLLSHFAAFSRAPVPMAVVRRELSCESYPIELRCPGTDVIMIESANYGRTDDKICDADPAQMENTRCYLPDAYKIMSQRCNNRTQCAVVAGPDAFPDPCPGTYKYLEVQYECVPYIFLCPGLLRGVYQSEHLFESDHQSGAWCKDPLQASDKIYYMPWMPYRTDTLTEYSSKEDFIAGRPTTTYKLPHRVDGTGFVVYDGALFFNKERTRNIVKFDLRTRIKSGEAIIASANYHDTSPYRWGGKSDIDLAVDENGLWVIYATEQNNGRIVISQLNPYTLRVEGTWDTAYDKRSASNAFMICGILYVVKTVYEDDDSEATGNKIDYIYNTELSKDGYLNIPFPNSYQYITAADYNPRDNLLYVWNNYHVVKYSLDFGVLDNRQESSSSGNVLMDTTTTHTTTRPVTVTLTTTSTTVTVTTTTTRSPASTTAAAPRSTTTDQQPAALPEVTARSDPSSVLPNIAVEFCSPVTDSSITWPKTRQGLVAKQPCPPGTVGTAVFTCQGPEGLWDQQGPDLSNCTSTWVNIINQKVWETHNQTYAWDNVHLLCTYTVRAMGHLIDLLDVQLRNLTPGGKDSAARSLNKAMVETVNNLLQPQARTAWMELSSGDQLRAATMLLDTVEQGAFVLADNLLKTDVVQENTENIQLEVARMSTDGNLPDLKFPQTGGQGNAIHLSANTLKQHGRNGTDMTRRFFFLVFQQSEENFNPNCSFWSYSKRSMTGFWSTQDCRLLGTNRTHTTCSCTHLTNFAVLMAHVDVKVETPQTHLDLIHAEQTRIRWFICIVTVAFSWFCVFFKGQHDASDVQKASIDVQVTRAFVCVFQIACAVFAALLHFFFLSAFTWMFLEGVQLYIMLVLAGYGIPALIVAVSAAVDYRSYGTDRVCWLRLDTYFIWSFIGPATLIIMLNVIFLGIALYKMFHHTAILKPDSGCLDNIKSWVIGAIALLCLLGLTWAFGLMYVNESTVIMAYLFTIFNSLQGMFIFIFHCVLQKKVRKEYGKCLRTHCYSGKSVDSSVGSVKSSSSRGLGRYSSASQVHHPPCMTNSSQLQYEQSRIRRMWNDTVRKQSESSFMAGDINSSATLNREGILNNARDTSAMDTLPLNGNHGNSYSLASADYMSDCVQIIDRTYNVHKETTLEKRILKELTSNYLPTYLNNHDRTAEHGRNLMNKLVNEVSNGGGVKDSPMLPVNLALGLDDSASFPHEDSLGLELIRGESNTPLLPPPRHVQPLPSTFSSASSSRRRLPQENSESFFPLLTEEQTEETPSPQRDSLYTSMPTLPDPERSDTHSLPHGGDTHTLPRSGEPDDVYYKSMPNLGSRNHLHQLHSYYQLGRGSSDGFIVPPKDELSPEETPQETTHMVTSL
uniref:Adhesion G protein-coupled receptor L3-like n=1 Tax=Sinocyclocheilus anshuiensis TaxID=1608454 RepID=A0A671MQT7_9TELE